MGWRLRKSIRVGKFFRINLSKSGIGASAGIPGTGISYAMSPSRAKATTEGPIVGCLSKVVMAFMLAFLGVVGLGLLASSFRKDPPTSNVSSASYPALPRPDPVVPPAPIAKTVVAEVPPPSAGPDPEPPKLSLSDRVAPIPIPTDQAASSRRAENLVRMGDNLAKAGNRKAALENYRRVILDFAGTPAAGDAAARLKAMAEKP